MKLLTVLLLGLSFVACSKKTECTTEPKDKWLDRDAFEQSLVEQGYKIAKFKVTEGNCYEIYGFDQEEQKVEIYFNPVDGSVVKEEKH